MSDLTSRLFLAPLAILLLVAGLAGCTKTAPDAHSGGNRLIPVRLQSDWFPQPEHGGYYQALAKGYYRDEGLDVQILPGGPNVQVLAKVATRRVDFGMANGDDVITAISRGVPVRMIAAEMQRDAQGILFHGEHPVRSLRELEGRTILAGAGSVWVQLVQRHYGIKFKLLPLAGDLTRFINDPDLLQQCFVTNELFFVRQHGIKVGAMLIAQPGYEPYRVVFTSPGYLAEHPEVARRFVRATIKGWIDYLTGDPTPANRILAQLRPDLTDEFFAYSIKAMRDYQLVLGDPERGEHMGQLAPARLEAQIKLLHDLGVLDRPVALKEVVDFDYLPDSAWPGGKRAAPAFR